MATNKFKSVMVNPSYELEFPTASEFVKVNNLAEIGKDVAFHNLVINSDGSPGKIELTDAESSINIGNGLLKFSCDVTSGLPRAIINSAGYGIELPSFITNENGVTFQSSPSPENSEYVSIDPVNGISTSGKLTINDTQGYAGWNFENGTIRNWNKYCDSEITTWNNDVDGGNGYSIINLTAKKYSGGRLDDSISIGLNGSTKTVTVSDNATVQLPANTTIGGNTPATFGDTVSGTLKDLTITDGIIISKNQLKREAAEFHGTITFVDNDDFNKRGITVEAYNFVENIVNVIEPGVSTKNGLYLYGWSTREEDYGTSVNGYIELSYGDSGEVKTTINSETITFNSVNSFTQTAQTQANFIINHENTSLSVDGAIDISSSNNGVTINGYGGVSLEGGEMSNMIIRAGQGVSIVADITDTYRVGNTAANISLQAPEVEISDTFTIPVYTTDDAGNYTKVNNERKTVRCVKQVLSDGTATYTLELA